MSTHVEQVESLIKRAVQTVLTRGLSDPRVRGLISVTKVKVSPDLANATVWVSVLPEEQAKLSLRGVQHAASHIRSQVSSMVAIRKTPRLSFQLDDSLKKQAAIHAAINQAVPQSPDEHEGDSADAPTRPPNVSEDSTQ